MMNNNQWVISDVSRQTGLEPHVLRYWEKELELDIPRNQLGHRYYLDCHIETFKKIHKLKESGYQLKAIKRVIKKNGMRESVDNDCEAKPIVGNNVQIIAQNESETIGQNIEQDTGRVIDEATEQVIGKTKTEALVDTVDIVHTVHTVNSMQKTVDADQTMIDQNVAASAEPVQDQTLAENHVNAKNVISMPKISIVTDETINKMQQSEKSEGNDKIEQFKRILGDIILDTMDKHSEELERRISDRIIKQMDYLLRVQEEMEEERFKQLDETIRAYQRDRKEGRRQHHFIMKRFHTPTHDLLIK